MAEDGRPHRLTRRGVLQAGAAAGAAVAAGAIEAEPAAANPGRNGTDSERILLRKGRIHTMDGRGSVADSVAIEGGRIAEIGRNLPPRGARVIDLGGRTVIPGLIDNHNHIVLMGNRPGYHTPLENAYTIADVQATYAKRAAGLPAGSWITTIGGFHRNHLVPPDQTPRLPTLAELDAAAPNHPVYLSEGFSGPSATNSRGKAFFETLGIPVGADGSIASGFDPSSPTGRATLALRQTLLTSDERKRGTVDAIAYGLSLGVTTHLDEGAFQAAGTPADGAAHEDNYTMHLPFLALHEEGKLLARVRINFLHMETDANTPGLAERLRNQFPFFGDDMLRTGGIGEFVAQGTGAAFAAAALKVAKAGWRAEVHSLSTTDFQAEIQAFEAANAQYPITDLRWVVAHVPFITQEYVNRLKVLGGGLSLTGWRYLAGTAAQAGPPFRMILDNGINSGMSSDGMQIAPMNPWLHMYYATTGRNARGAVINVGQQITRQEVLRLYTRDNGWFLREENQLGSLEVGKFADLVVLDRDYFTIPDEELKKIRSALTMVGGNIVHTTGAVG